MENRQKHDIEAADDRWPKRPRLEDAIQPLAPVASSDDSSEEERFGFEDIIRPLVRLASPSAASHMFNRPLAEPPIFSYDKIIDYAECNLKRRKEKPHLYHPNISSRMLELDLRTENELEEMYITWTSDMVDEAHAAENKTAAQFYEGLENALARDHRKDCKRDLKEGWDELYLRGAGFASPSQSIHSSEDAALQSSTDSTRIKNGTLRKSGSGQGEGEQSEGSEAYMTADEGTSSGS